MALEFVVVAPDHPLAHLTAIRTCLEQFNPPATEGGATRRGNTRSNVVVGQNLVFSAEGADRLARAPPQRFPTPIYEEIFNSTRQMWRFLTKRLQGSCRASDDTRGKRCASAQARSRLPRHIERMDATVPTGKMPGSLGAEQVSRDRVLTPQQRELLARRDKMQAAFIAQIEQLQAEAFARSPCTRNRTWPQWHPPYRFAALHPPIILRIARHAITRRRARQNARRTINACACSPTRAGFVSPEQRPYPYWTRIDTTQCNRAHPARSPTHACRP